jgi:hypothetical protein
MVIAIAGAIVIVGVFMLSIGMSLLGGIVGEVGAAVGDAVTRMASQAPATVAPSGVALDTPLLDQPPNHGYTNQAQVVITGTVPQAAVGKTGYLVRLYSVANDSSRTKLADIGVGATTHFSTPTLTLSEGVSTFVVTLVSPSGEGNSSPPVTYTLDTKPPNLKITSPSSSTVQKGSSVQIAGTSDPGATIAIRNRQSTSGAPSSAVADASGNFKLSVRLVAGDNTIEITATDQAGNVATTNMTIKRDYGQLAAHLSASPAKIKADTTTTLTLTVHATSSTGSPLANATVVFTANVSGLGPIVSSPATTDAKGTATWTTQISGAVTGSGWASVLVTSDAGDQVSGTTPLNTQ